MNNSKQPLTLKALNEKIEELLDKYGEDDSVAYYYDANKKTIIKGKLVLPHKEPQELKNERLLFIGGQDEYDFYYIKLGIRQFFSNGGKVACVGFNPEKNEFFGWSHRGYGRFYVGYVVKEKSMLSEQIAAGYVTKTLQHCKVLAHIFADLMD